MAAVVSGHYGVGAVAGSAATTGLVPLRGRLPLNLPCQGEVPQLCISSGSQIRDLGRHLSVHTGTEGSASGLCALPIERGRRRSTPPPLRGPPPLCRGGLDVDAGTGPVLLAHGMRPYGWIRRRLRLPYGVRALRGCTESTVVACDHTGHGAKRTFF